MTKRELREALNTCKTETKTALETILAELNHGQRKKIVKSEAVKALLDRYGVDYGS